MNEEPSSYLPSSGILTAKPVSFEVTPAMLRSQLRHGSIAKPTNDSSHRQKIRNRAISSMKDEQLQSRLSSPFVQHSIDSHPEDQFWLVEVLYTCHKKAYFWSADVESRRVLRYIP